VPVQLPDQVLVQRASSTYAGAAAGEVSGTLVGDATAWEVHVEGSARVTPRIEALVAPIPELHIEDTASGSSSRPRSPSTPAPPSAAPAPPAS